MAKKLPRCANPKCGKSFKPRRPDQEYCGESCVKAAKRQRKKALAAANSVFAPADIIKRDAERAASLARDYRDSAVNMRELAAKAGVDGVLFLPGPHGVLMVWPKLVTQDDWADIHELDFGRGMLTPWWRKLKYTIGLADARLTPEQRALSDVNTIQQCRMVSTDPPVRELAEDALQIDKSRAHHQIVEDVIHGPPRSCILFSFRPFQEGGGGANHIGDGRLASTTKRADPGARDGWTNALLVQAWKERRAEMTRKEAARKIELELDDGFRKQAFATSRNEAGYARRRHRG